jgi:hypothetical protein
MSFGITNVIRNVFLVSSFSVVKHFNVSTFKILGSHPFWVDLITFWALLNARRI